MLKDDSFLGDEYNPFNFFDRFGEEVGGERINDEFHLKNEEIGEIHSILYKYMDALFIGVTDINLNKDLTFKNKPLHDHKYVSIRIGQAGNFDNKTALLRDSIYIYNNLQEFEISYPAHTNMRWLFIRFPLAFYDLFSEDSQSKLYKLISNDEPWFYYSPILPQIETLLKDIYLCLEDKSIRRAIFLSKSIELITQLRLHGDKNQFKNIVYNIHSDDLKLMIEVKDEILKDYSHQPNLDQLCKKFGISESKLQRTFKKVFQKPILQFFNTQRITEGRKMVKQNTKDLTQIALELGFSDLSHFSKVYKKQFGVRPSEDKLMS
ncbi:AraC family transcriptional regulator [Flammeovirga sp. SubArs3]|uniref:helix-turn-helix transcriptional regulator n=1 Tax=Flammeovirga sp. SubArs3 TaxID=2995316 RepID=UPI00248CDD23|nr:AraC family transcriptional regulator [Flammeovirga sp. SubArs3]